MIRLPTLRKMIYSSFPTPKYSLIDIIWRHYEVIWYNLLAEPKFPQFYGVWQNIKLANSLVMFSKSSDIMMTSFAIKEGQLERDPLS